MKIKNKYGLMKLLITLGITTIILIMVILAYQNYLQSHAALTIANELAADLNLARLNAISTGQQVALCPIQDNAALNCGDQTKWINGWVVFTDVNNNYAMDEKTNRLHINHLSHINGVTIRSNTAQVGYNPLGTLNSVELSVIIRPTLCFGVQVRTVSVSVSGQLSVDATAC
jgi:Tfp pilus assembly protein FimT